MLFWLLYLKHPLGRIFLFAATRQHPVTRWCAMKVAQACAIVYYAPSWIRQWRGSHA